MPKAGHEGAGAVVAGGIDRREPGSPVIGALQGRRPQRRDHFGLALSYLSKPEHL